MQLRRGVTEGRALVLVAAADATLRQEAREFLSQLGVEVAEVADAAAAVDILQSRRPDLVLVDARQPDGAGLATCRELRSQPSLQEMPILVMVPSDDANLLADVFAAGANEVIRSPILGPILGRRVRLLLDRSECLADVDRTQRRLESLQRIARIATWECDLASGVLDPSEEVRTLFGLAAEPGPIDLELLLEKMDAEDQQPVRGHLLKSAESGEGFNVDTRVRLPDEEARVIQWQAEVLCNRDGDPTRLSGTMQDVTERKRAEDQVRFLAYHDGLTGLTNRNAFMERLRSALRIAKRHRRSVALLFLDLDNFKRINDTQGHSAGDRLLQGVAQRLDQCLRQTDYVAMADGVASGAVSRLGGDEFTVLLTEVTNSEDAARVARRIIDALREPFLIDRVELVVGASIGITVYPADGVEIDTLLRNADAAMYQAKERGRNNYQFFTESINEAALRRLALEEKLCRAFENSELQLYYQPQVNMATNRITGVEALLRWEDPEFGAISPAEFVPLAENAGLIVPIGTWVLRTACWQAKRWNDLGLPRMRMAVNISPLQFQDETLIETINQTLWDTNVKATDLELEITENALMENQESVIIILRKLKEIGVSVSLDDFGTGYSSLSYLKRFPVDTVKIDRSFVRDVISDTDGAAITEAIISMAKALQLRVVAEGVETERQREFLCSKGCEESQGYLFSPPVKADVITQMVRAQVL